MSSFAEHEDQQYFRGSRRRLHLMVEAMNGFKKAKVALNSVMGKINVRASISES